MYNEKIIELFKNPINVGMIKNADAAGRAENAECGDVIRIYIKVDEDEIIQDAKFKAYGNAVSIAAATVSTQLIIKKSLKEAIDVRAEEISAILGVLPEQKKYCPILAEEAIKATVEDFFIRREKEEKKLLKNGK